MKTLPVIKEETIFPKFNGAYSNGGKMKAFISIFTKSFESPVANFLLFSAANILVYVTVFGGLMDVLPPRLVWVSSIAFPLCVISGFITSVIAVRKAKGILPSTEAVAKASVITILGLLVLVSLYVASFAITPTPYLTIEQFEDAGLNPNQVAQLQKYLDAQGYVTLRNLDNINLTTNQKIAVNKVMNELGYITEEDSKYIAQTQIALVVTQTAVARLSSCFITPEFGTSTVAVRQSPSDKSDYVGAFSEGQKLHVIGHNGGRMNQDRWWLVEFSNEGNDNQYGWVASWVVQEINESECIRVEKTPGY